MTIDIENDLEYIDSALVNMVEKCPRLYYLDVAAMIQPNTVDLVCYLQEQGKICMYARVLITL